MKYEVRAEFEGFTKIVALLDDKEAALTLASKLVGMTLTDAVFTGTCRNAKVVERPEE